MREFMRLQLLSWYEVIKIDKFSKKLGLKSSSVSTFIKYGAKTLSDDKIEALYNSILDYMRKFA